MYIYYGAYVGMVENMAPMTKNVAVVPEWDPRTGRLSLAGGQIVFGGQASYLAELWQDEQIRAYKRRQARRRRRHRKAVARQAAFATGGRVTKERANELLKRGDEVATTALALARTGLSASDRADSTHSAEIYLAQKLFTHLVQKYRRVR